MEESLYSRQTGYLVFLYLLGSSLIYVPESFIGRDVWISSFLGSILGLYVLHIFISLQKMFPGQNIMQISKLSLGKFTGTLFNTAFLLVILLIAMLNLFDMVVFLSIIYKHIPRIFLMLVIIMGTSLVIYAGITSAGHTADLFTWPVMVFLILSLLILIPLFQIPNLVPVLSKPGQVLLGAIYGANWPYLQISLMSLILPYVIDLREDGKKIYHFYILAAGLLITRSLFVQASLGPQMLEISRFPFYDAIRLVQFSNFQRIELFFFILFWSVTSSVVILSYRSMVLGLQNFFALRNYQVLILPTGFLILTLAMYTLPSGLQFNLKESNTIVFLTLPVHILYPTIIFLAARWRKKLLLLKKPAI